MPELVAILIVIITFPLARRYSFFVVNEYAEMFNDITRIFKK